MDELKKQALLELANSSELNDLQAIKVKYLGKKGLITQELKGLGKLPPEQRKAQGAAINVVKQELSKAIEARKEVLEAEQLARALEAEALDVTLPGRALPVGNLHLISKVIYRLEDIFRSLGYEVATGPELETEHYNFNALNIPDWHPARDLQDTFWTTDGRVLRTQTSPMQIRYMEQHTPPFKVIIPGKTFRNEAVDATHEAQFHQLEALVVGERITMADLKGAINEMATAIFGEGTKTKLKPSYFPFVEPGAEFAIWWQHPVKKEWEWLELGGCGMVHPNVFRAAGYDPDKVTGFAFGFGIERLALIPYGLPDIRYFYNGDMRVLEQFRGAL